MFKKINFKNIIKKKNKFFFKPYLKIFLLIILEVIILKKIELFILIIKKSII